MSSTSAFGPVCAVVLTLTVFTVAPPRADGSAGISMLDVDTTGSSKAVAAGTSAPAPARATAAGDGASTGVLPTKRSVVKTLTGRTITGYSQEDGWNRNRAARRTLHKGPISSFEEALAKQKEGVPFDAIPPVLVAQSMKERPFPYATRVMIEVNEGPFKGVRLPGIILDCGAFGAHHFDIYTTHTKTAYALTSKKAKIHILK